MQGVRNPVREMWGSDKAAKGQLAWQTTPHPLTVLVYMHVQYMRVLCIQWHSCIHIAADHRTDYRNCMRV